MRHAPREKQRGLGCANVSRSKCLYPGSLWMGIILRAQCAASEIDVNMRIRMESPILCLCVAAQVSSAQPFRKQRSLVLLVSARASCRTVQPLRETRLRPYERQQLGLLGFVAQTLSKFTENFANIIFFSAFLGPHVDIWQKLLSGSCTRIVLRLLDF